MPTLCSTAGSVPCERLAATDEVHSVNLSATAQPANTTAGATFGRQTMHSATATSGSCSFLVNGATAVALNASITPNDRLEEGVNTTAMSIDTPSYARSLGLGQLGSAAGFAGSLFQGSQDLAQSMSIDGVQVQHLLGRAAATSGTGRHFIILFHHICLNKY